MGSTPQRRARGWVALVLASVLGAGLVTAGPLAQASPRGFTAQVTVTYQLAVDGERHRVRVTCPEDRSRACRVLRRHAEILRPDPQRACTAQYGGPERARIRGTVDGRKVDVVITRADGCGISDWAALVGLLPAV